MPLSSVFFFPACSLCLTFLYAVQLVYSNICDVSIHIKFQVLQTGLASVLRGSVVLVYHQEPLQPQDPNP